MTARALVDIECAVSCERSRKFKYRACGAKAKIACAGDVDGICEACSLSEVVGIFDTAAGSNDVDGCAAPSSQRIGAEFFLSKAQVATIEIEGSGVDGDAGVIDAEAAVVDVGDTAVGLRCSREAQLATSGFN